MGILRIGLEWFKNPDHVPFFIAEELGWLAEVNIQTELIVPDVHLDALQAINDGILDIAITEPLHIIEDRSEGHKTIGFARFLHTNGGVMYVKNKGIERAKDMARKGLRIQYPGAPGPGGPAIVSSMIEFDEGQCDITTFERVNNGFMHTDAIVNDIADVATLAFSNFELIEAKHRGLDVDFFALKDYGIPDFNQLILITSEECFEQKKEDIKLLVKILHRAVLYIKTNPIEAKQIYFKYSDTTSDDFTNECYDTTAKCFTSDFSMELSYYESLNQWMYSKKITGKSVDVNNENLWSNELVSDLLVK